MIISFSPTLRTYNAWLTLCCTALLSSCAVGPDFTKPSAPADKSFTSTATPDAVGSGPDVQHFAQNKDVPADWWTLFSSDPLNDLVKQALAANPDMDSARAALRTAQEVTYADEGAWFPSISAEPSIEREKFSPAEFGGLGGTSTSVSPFTIYNASVGVSYGLDVFGLTQRAVESDKAKQEYARFTLEATYLTLTGNIMTTAVEEASLREQIDASEKIIAIDQQELDILRKQLALGGVAKPAVLAQEMTLMQDQAKLPALQKQLAGARHLLAALTGRTPATALPETFTLESLHLPHDLPLTVPSDLVEQRPDIKAAEATIHSASAEIGVATANMLPQISLSGSIGEEALTFSGLSSASAGIWSIGAGLTQPVFEGGTLLHKRREAVAAYDQAAAQYRSTVITAFRNVADTLRALEYDAKSHEYSADNANVAADSLAIAQEQRKDGAISTPQLLEAKRTNEQARITLAQALALRLNDSVALYQALGGGWQKRSFSLTSTSMEQPK